MNLHLEKILIVEDDLQIQTFIHYALSEEGYDCIIAKTGKEALHLSACNHVDLILLDLGLPDLDGMEIIQRIRTWSDMPILVVSARDQDKQKVEALDAGADDYLTKPFSSTELMARIRVALRHKQQQQKNTAPAAAQVGDLEVNWEKRLVYLSGEELHLTPMEYKLLSLFFNHTGKVLTTGFIIKKIWGMNYGTDTQALRTLMAGLRRKIEKNPATPRYIVTEIGVGYRLMDT